jgi:hypothetical protein
MRTDLSRNGVDITDRYWQKPNCAAYLAEAENSAILAAGEKHQDRRMFCLRNSGVFDLDRNDAPVLCVFLRRSIRRPRIFEE